jgi:23S rRNA (cytosine1962-C5)-methyltransferase
MNGKSVLNAFAYTGSLGVAATGAGARRVLQLDRAQRFLDLARASYSLNRFPVRARDFVRADFFREAGRLRRLRRTFDCVFLDPPFFSSTTAGVVDQESQTARLINKVRPLVTSGGYLVAVNNALYVSGAAFMRVLESLCADRHLEIVELIPVPADFTGMSPAHLAAPITDPTPFNHSTKIAVLMVI